MTKNIENALFTKAISSWTLSFSDYCLSPSNRKKVAASNDGTHLAIIDSDKESMFLFSIPKNQLIAKFPLIKPDTIGKKSIIGQYRQLFSKDSNHLLEICNQTIQIYNLQNLENQPIVIRIMNKNPIQIYSSQNFQFYVAYIFDFLLVIYSLQNGEIVAQLDILSQINLLIKDYNFINCLHFTSNNMPIVSVCNSQYLIYQKKIPLCNKVAFIDGSINYFCYQREGHNIKIFFTSKQKLLRKIKIIHLFFALHSIVPYLTKHDLILIIKITKENKVIEVHCFNLKILENNNLQCQQDFECPNFSTLIRIKENEYEIIQYSQPD